MLNSKLDLASNTANMAAPFGLRDFVGGLRQQGRIEIGRSLCGCLAEESKCELGYGTRKFQKLWGLGAYGV